jgi:hypothetical protein
MKRNEYLVKAANSLKKSAYSARFLDVNALEVCLDKKSNAVAFLVVEPHFPGIIVSFALDFRETQLVADMLISLFYVCPVALGESFYQSQSNQLYWGDEAEFYYMIEQDNNVLEDLEPINKNHH